MHVTRTAIADVLLLRPPLFTDERGFFMESWNQRDFDRAVGRPVRFVQDNHSGSAPGVLRGLHYQVGQPQGKLVRVVRGAVYDVAVDLRRSSPSFGRWVGHVLSADNRLQSWIPAGLAHGFLALEDGAEVCYKTTGHRVPELERCLRWDDATLGVAWPLAQLGLALPRLSPRDAAAPCWPDAELLP